MKKLITLDLNLGENYGNTVKDIKGNDGNNVQDIEGNCGNNVRDIEGNCGNTIQNLAKCDSAAVADQP